MKLSMSFLAAMAVAAMGAASAQATTYDVNLTGSVADFSASQFTFNGDHYDRFILPLSGLDSSNAFTILQGDSIDSTVTLDGAYTIPTSQLYTNILQIFTGSSFPSENTGVNGTFEFFDGTTQVASFGYSSSTSGQLSSYAANFPPSNGAFTFDSFTNQVSITSLPTPATVDGSYFFYDLVSSATPEPAAWAMMLIGFFGLGAVLRARRTPATAIA